MNRTIGLQLLVYGAVTACLSYLAYRLAPGLAMPALWAGLVGGGLCVLWALAALAGRRGKALPILTLMGMSFLLLAQTVTGWFEQDAAPGHRSAVLVITGAFVLSVLMLMRIAYAGMGSATTTTNAPATPVAIPGPREPQARRS